MYLHLHVVNLRSAAVVGNVLFTNMWAQKMLNFSSFLNFQMLILLRVEIKTNDMLQYVMTGGDHSIAPRLDFYNTDRHNFTYILDVTAEGFFVL